MFIFVARITLVLLWLVLPCSCSQSDAPTESDAGVETSPVVDVLAELPAIEVLIDSGEDSSVPEETSEIVGDDSSHDVMIDSGVDSPTFVETSEIEGDESSLDVPCADGFVYIDFPCYASHGCVDEHVYHTLTTIGCLAAGFDPTCCSGAGCEPSDPISCPDGTLCVEPTEGYREEGEPCRILNCGSPDDPPCPDDKYCERPAGQCDARGICILKLCRERLGHSATYFEENGWQCGCDGRTYPNACERRAAETSFAYLDACCVPSRVAFPPENPEKWMKWVACVAPEDIGGDYPKEIYDLLHWARRYSPAEPLGCLPGEIGYTGAMDVHVGDPPEPKKYLALCWLASLPGVRTVFGINDYECDGVPCYEWLTCAQSPYCPSPCGCCECEPGLLECGNDEMASWGYTGIVTCEDDCWSYTEWCDFGQECIRAAGSVRCDFTCHSLEKAWEGAINQTSGCAGDSDCVVLPGDCEGGLGPCWIAIRPDEFITSDTFSEFATEWNNLNCGTAQSCSCGPQPAANCVQFRCVLSESVS